MIETRELSDHKLAYKLDALKRTAEYLEAKTYEGQSDVILASPYYKEALRRWKCMPKQWRSEHERYNPALAPLHGVSDVLWYFLTRQR